MAGGKKRKLADDGMADYGTTDKEFDSDNEFDSEEVMRNADLHPGGGSDNEFDSEEVMRNADLHPGGGSDNEFDSEELMRMADLHLPGGGSDKIVNFQKFQRMNKICNKEKEENRGSQYGLDFWMHIFSVGTTRLNGLHFEHNCWNFSNLQDALEEGGVLHVDNYVYLFSSVEESFPCCHHRKRRRPHHRKRRRLVNLIPVVVAVVSPFPPTHKIGMYSMNGYKKIVDMKTLGMHWDPYIPIKNRSHFHTGSSSWKHERQIFVLSCADRTTSLECVKRFNKRVLLEDCIPYFDDPLKKQTCVDIIYPSEPEPEFTIKLIEAEELSEHHKDGFKEYVSVKVREIQRANDEVRLQLSREEVAAVEFKNMRLYKFYPVPTSETPVAHQWKMSRSINGYDGGAHGIF
ncbi:hypothetical protein CTI12_AA359140 [Artemisia annua]|uniref:Uncharacterized protein n=1 Tax=Artemisia annua TaxID=35608 RepID=A0A2U1MP06_ARTAN|nr:hypothetical protein CTI12_AA359140 [Artemisia annua]